MALILFYFFSLSYFLSILYFSFIHLLNIVSYCCFAISSDLLLFLDIYSNFKRALEFDSLYWSSPPMSPFSIKKL